MFRWEPHRCQGSRVLPVAEWWPLLNGGRRGKEREMGFFCWPQPAPICPDSAVFLITSNSERKLQLLKPRPGKIAFRPEKLALL